MLARLHQDARQLWQGAHKQDPCIRLIKHNYCVARACSRGSTEMLGNFVKARSSLQPVLHME